MCHKGKYAVSSFHNYLLLFHCYVVSYHVTKGSVMCDNLVKEKLCIT